MFNLVLLTALAGPSVGVQPYFVADPCPYCIWPVLPLGGRVVFYWNGPAALSEQEEQEWRNYLGSLDETDQKEARYYWNAADRAGKQRLLGQVRQLRAKKEEREAKQREDELKAKQKKEEETSKPKPEKKDEKKENKSDNKEP